VGRLDFDSEGLLILTNDSSLNHRLLHPRFAHNREYWVQVEGQVTEEALRQLAAGPEINLNGKPYKTRSTVARAFTSSPDLPDRYPPIRFRKEIPTSWISLTLTEGKNRQVRKMTAKVGLPTLRLIRYRIEDLTIQGMAPGEMKRLDAAKIFNGLFHAPRR
jgi:23S rRNA pseudouridine2457 synthase